MDYLDTMAQTYFESGQFEEAMKVERKCLVSEAGRQRNDEPAGVVGTDGERRRISERDGSIEAGGEGRGDF